MALVTSVIGVELAVEVHGVCDWRGVGGLK